jgi:arsenite methyltransferase
MESKMTFAAGADAERIVGEVRKRYADIATGGAGCCTPSSCGCTAPEAVSEGIGYSPDDLDAVPDANLGLGCGAPIPHLALKPGEAVLDLGSGPGLDAFLAARQVGPAGRVIGVDMTPAMLERARSAAAHHGFTWVEFREGRLEALPVVDSSIDAVTSNCVINLVPDKGRVFAEVARVLRPGGRIVISDIILDAELPPAIKKDVLAYVGCVSGAVSRETYFQLIRAAGLGEIEVLRDVDYLANLADAAPEEAASILDRAHLTLDDVKGIVRSVTFRARKPRA